MSNVARKATAFPLWRAMESRWNGNTISVVSSVTAVIRLIIIIIIIIIFIFKLLLRGILE